MPRLFDSGAPSGQPRVTHERVLTAANGITVVRLLGLPLYAWLVLGPHRVLAAVVLLGVIAGSDWVDGYVARRFDQVTRVGKLLDPLVDRALLATVGLTLAVAGMLPWWVVAVVVGRDVLLGVTALVQFGRLPEIPVTRLGKASTACLLLGLPLLQGSYISWAGGLRVPAWCAIVAGVASYLVVGAQYLRAGWALRRADRIKGR